MDKHKRNAKHSPKNGSPPRRRNNKQRPPRPGPPIDVRKAVVMHAVAHGPLAGWVHTHGMRTLGLPELEARELPQYLMRPAANLLWDIADYMLYGERPVQLGERMHIEGHGMIVFCKLPPLPGLADHYECERWAIADDVDQPCDACQRTGFDGPPAEDGHGSSSQGP